LSPVDEISIVQAYSSLLNILRSIAKTISY